MLGVPLRWSLGAEGGPKGSGTAGLHLALGQKALHPPHTPVRGLTQMSSAAVACAA